MAGKKEITWKVVREYKNLYSPEELIHRIIRRYLGCSDMEESEDGSIASEDPKERS